jgi:hypothetical protein
MKMLFRYSWRLKSLDDYFGSHYYYMDRSNDREDKTEGWERYVHASNVFGLEKLTKGLV